MKCNHCKHEIPSWSVYCPVCGKQLKIVPRSADANYCGMCGHSLNDESTTGLYSRSEQTVRVRSTKSHSHFFPIMLSVVSLAITGVLSFALIGMSNGLDKISTKLDETNVKL